MTDRAYSELLLKARSDLANAKAKKFALENRIARLERTVVALTCLVEEPKLDPTMGITAAIKAALRLVSPRAVSPMTIRVTLENAGFDFSRQKNPMASIHSILRRLQRQCYIESRTSREGKMAWAWVVADVPQLEATAGPGMQSARDLFEQAAQFFAEDEG